MDRLRPYPAMKDSGVDWPREVPAHREGVALRRYCQVFAGAAPSRAIPEYRNGGTVPWLASGDAVPRHRYAQLAAQGSHQKVGQGIPRHRLGIENVIDPLPHGVEGDESVIHGWPLGIAFRTMSRTCRAASRCGATTASSKWRR